MSDFSVSTDDIDILDSESSHSMSLLSLPAQLREGEDSSLGVAQTNVEDDINDSPVKDGIAIDSFLPLLGFLGSPNFKQADDGKYYISGSPTKESVRSLAAYARTVTKITLDRTHSNVAPGTWLRLMQLLRRHTNSDVLFPSLKHLVIDIRIPASLSLLPLFLVPTLQTLDVLTIPAAESQVFLTFLSTLTTEAPGLSRVVLGDNIPYSAALHLACIDAAHLRELYLYNVGPTMSWSALQELGRLPELETLVLDEQEAFYRVQLPRAQPQTSPVNKLGKVQYTEDEARAKKKPPSKMQEMRAREVMEESKLMDPIGLMPPQRIPSPAPSFRSINTPLDSESTFDTPNPEILISGSPSFQKLKSIRIVAKLDLIDALIGSIKTPCDVIDMSLTVLPPHTLTAKATQTTASAPGAIPLPPCTRSFQDILVELLGSTTLSLKEIKLRCPGTLGELELPALKALLAQPNLRNLDVSGCAIGCDIGDAFHHLSIATYKRPSGLRSIRLPVNLGAKGISLNRLREIFGSYPDLTSFECGFKHLSNVPPIPAERVRFESLKELRAGNPAPHEDRQRLRDIMQYLDALFPNLEKIETQEGCNAEQWKEIAKDIKACQFSRSYHFAQTDAGMRPASFD